MNLFKKFFLGFVALVFISLVTIGLMLATVPQVLGQSKSYHSGDAVSYRGQLVFGTANQGKIEIFKLQGDQIERTARIVLQTAGTSFSDPVLLEEAGGLYLYVVDGKNLYKYNISDLQKPILVRKVNELGFGDWFSSVQHADGRIVTVGASGLKLWTPALERIDSYKLAVANPYNLILSPRGAFIFYLERGLITMFNAPGRNAIAFFNNFDQYGISQASVFMRDNHDHRIFNDDAETKLYLVDDRELKQLDFTAKNTKTFRHISNLGYDVAGIPGASHLYFSDGLGVVKIDKNNFKPITWVYTTSKFGVNGWAMGLRAVKTDAGERLVIFNNSAILVMDDQLELRDSYKYNENEVEPAVESLSLKLNTYSAPAGSIITVSGTGFGAAEPLELTFAGVSFSTQADAAGSFTKLITVPQVSKRRTDIKVTGEITKASYSVAFEIE